MRYFYFFLLLCSSLNSFGQNPNWQAPDQSQFSFSMNVIADLSVDQAISYNTLDTIAFFVGNELRGLGAPVDIGSGVILHFITLYSNVAAETMTIQAYHFDNGLVFDAFNTIQFTPQTVLGSTSDPYTVDCYFNTSPPFYIESIPFQTTVEGIPIDTINLNDYLVQSSSVDVTWSYSTNASLQVTLIDSFLIAQGTSGFIGTTVLGITATENNTSMNMASGGIFINVGQAYSAPAFTIDMMQGIQVGGSFIDMDLVFYENVYNGPCLNYEYVPILVPSSTPVSKPNWTINNFGSTTMNLVVKADYTPQHNLSNIDDELAIFVDGQLRGVGSPVAYQGNILFYVTIAGNGPESSLLEIRYFSDDKEEILTKMTAISYFPNAIYGNADQPYLVDFSPLLPSIDANGVLSMSVINANWSGEEMYEIKAADCTYPTYIFGSDMATFCVSETTSPLQMYYIDQDNDGDGSNLFSISACPGSYEGWSLNNQDCNDSDPTVTAIEYTLNIQEQSIIPNDGHVCSGTDVTLMVNTLAAIEWFDGSHNSTLIYNVVNSDSVSFTLMDGGCTSTISQALLAEIDTVSSSLDQGPGSLRSVLACAEHNSDIYFNQTHIDTCYLLGDLIVDKSVRLKGLSENDRPVIAFDFQNLNQGLQVTQGIELELEDVDLSINNSGVVPGKLPFLGPGKLKISGKTAVRR